jgi:hypothetical protein
MTNTKTYLKSTTLLFPSWFTSIFEIWTWSSRLLAWYLKDFGGTDCRKFEMFLKLPKRLGATGRAQFSLDVSTHYNGEMKSTIKLCTCEYLNFLPGKLNKFKQ